MENIRSDSFTNICPWEVVGVRLEIVTALATEPKTNIVNIQLSLY